MRGDIRRIVSGPSTGLTCRLRRINRTNVPSQAHQQDLGLHLDGAERVAVLVKRDDILVGAHVGPTVVILHFVRLQQKGGEGGAVP